MSLPKTNDERKALPIFDGCIRYFPDALAAVTEVSVNGNNQHNPGEPLHWARGKSTDQFNTALRHLIDHTSGSRYDYRWDATKATWVYDGRHLAKAAWRILAALQVDIELFPGLPPPYQPEAPEKYDGEASAAAYNLAAEKRQKTVVKEMFPIRAHEEDLKG